MNQVNQSTPADVFRAAFSRLYQHVLLNAIEELEKGDIVAEDWFRNDRENVSQVARAAGFSSQAVLREISYPLRNGEPLSEIRKRIRAARAAIAAETS